jgi:hypothetical protein
MRSPICRIGIGDRERFGGEVKLRMQRRSSSNWEDILSTAWRGSRNRTVCAASRACATRCASLRNFDQQKYFFVNAKSEVEQRDAKNVSVDALQLSAFAFVETARKDVQARPVIETVAAKFCRTLQTSLRDARPPQRRDCPAGRMSRRQSRSGGGTLKGKLLGEAGEARRGSGGKGP